MSELVSELKPGPYTPGLINSPADWRGPDMAARDDWIHTLSNQEVAEIDAALAHVKEKGIGFAGMTKENFALPRFSSVAAQAQEYLENGPGLFLIRGFPANDYDHADLRLVYWGLGLYLGTAVTQSRDGDVLGDVRDLKVDVQGPRGRGYRTNQQLSFHCDSADVTGLFVLRTPRSGGLSMIASSLAIRNEIARVRPDLLEVLYTPFHWTKQERYEPGEEPTYLQPVFSEHQGYFACRMIRMLIENAVRYDGAPPLTEAQSEALDLFGELAASEAFSFAMMFEPGDLQLLNNHVALHARTAFEDYPEPERKRHLLRLWLAMPNSRPLSPLMSHFYRDQRAGAVRGGYTAFTDPDHFVYETPLVFGDRPDDSPGERI